MSSILTSTEKHTTIHYDKFNIDPNEKITDLNVALESRNTIEEVRLSMGSWAVLQFQNSSNFVEKRRVIKNFSPFLALIINIKLSDQAAAIQYVVKRKNNYMYDYDVMDEKDAEVFTYAYWGYPVAYVLGHWNTRPTPKQYAEALRKRLPLITFSNYVK